MSSVFSPPVPEQKPGITRHPSPWETKLNNWKLELETSNVLDVCVLFYCFNCLSKYGQSLKETCLSTHSAIWDHMGSRSVCVFIILSPSHVHVQCILYSKRQSCSRIHSPRLGDIDDSGIGLSYRPASLCSLADW